MMKSYTKTGTAATATASTTTMATTDAPTTTTTTTVTTTAPVVQKKKGVKKTEEANEVAGFLLSLKNQRSVSPDPNDPPDTAITTATTTGTTTTDAPVVTSDVAPELTTTNTATAPLPVVETTTESVTAVVTAAATVEVDPTMQQLPPTTTEVLVTPVVIGTTSTSATTNIETTTNTTSTTEPLSSSLSSSTTGGVITGYAGPPPEMTTFPGIPVVYPTMSFPYSNNVNISGMSTTTSTPLTKKVNGKEKKLKKSLESGLVGTDDVNALQAMIDEFVEYDLTKFVDESNPLVQYKDRDLVPDPLFVAMLQMKVCYLTQADRVGCYKTRDLGFVGMCCKHCNGQPGFGRYFPNSVRSLAQTTTSQTILKHIASKCRFCPPNIRDVVVELMRQQTIKEAAVAALTTNTIHNVIAGASSSSSSSDAMTGGGGNNNNNNAVTAAGRPRYGSRKIFFHRVWSRLHAGTLGITTTDDDMEDYHHQMGGDGGENDDSYIPTSVIDDVVTEAVGQSVAEAAAEAAFKMVEQENEATLAAAEAMTTTAATNKRTLPLMGKNKKQKLEEESAAV